MKIINGKPGRLQDWLIVLGIIVILFQVSGFHFGGERAMTIARRTAAAANLHSIAQAYSVLVVKNDLPTIIAFQPGDTVHNLAQLLAREENLNDASLWVIKIDPRLNGQSIPRSVMVSNSKGIEINPEFAKMLLGFEMAWNIPGIAPPATTPIGWTRGLRLDGTWAKDSPWQGDGGHVAFLDGHVEWHGKLGLAPGDDPLVKYGTTTPTVNIREALPPGAIVLSAEPNSAPAKAP